METPKKLIRRGIIPKLKEGEWEVIEDQSELNLLYSLKVMEELEEIQESNHSDIMEFVDLIQVAFAFAEQNGFSMDDVIEAAIKKGEEKGGFGNVALNNLNPLNPSNRLYFAQE